MYSNFEKPYLHLLLQQFDYKFSGTGKAKVAFMARTNPLVQQQFTLFKNYLGKESVSMINDDLFSLILLSN